MCLPCGEHRISISCPSGGLKPDELIGYVIQGTALSLVEAIFVFDGHWTWIFTNIPSMQWEQVRPIIRMRIQSLYNKGIISYGSW